MKRMSMSGVTTVFLVLGWLSISHAFTVLFTDESAWRTEVSSLGYGTTTIDFENTGSPDSFTVVAGDVIFSSPGIPLEVSDLFGIPYDSGMVLYPAFNQPLQIELPESVFAFGFDLGDLGGLLPPLYSPPTLSDIVLSTGETFGGPFAGNPFPTFAFFGFLSDLAITGLSMHPQGSIEAILDNFTYARAAAPVPEPSSMLLLGVGIVGLVASKWRNRGRR